MKISLLLQVAFQLSIDTHSNLRICGKGQLISEWIYEVISQNTKETLSRFLPCVVRAEILTIFCSYFGRNDDFINLFWDLLTFINVKTKTEIVPNFCDLLRIHKLYLSISDRKADSKSCLSTTLNWRQTTNSTRYAKWCETFEVHSFICEWAQFA